jgi:3-hydroxypropanoate dehydrogenase
MKTDLMSWRETMKITLTDEALNQIFRDARTHGAWLDKPVSEEILRQLYDLMKWGPTSANGSPARFVFLRTPASLSGGCPD